MRSATLAVVIIAAASASAGPRIQIAAHLGRVDALAWKGALLASAASDYQIKVWDIAP